jgi:hypothetical protein
LRLGLPQHAFAAREQSGKRIPRRGAARRCAGFLRYGSGGTSIAAKRTSRPSSRMKVRPSMKRLAMPRAMIAPA